MNQTNKNQATSVVASHPADDSQQPLPSSRRDDPSQDHNSFEQSNCSIEVFSSFDEMNLSTSLLRGIYSYGWEKPSAIQQRAIVPFIQGGDLIAQAQSGTGKTGAFSIGTLSRIDFTVDACQALILSPTRELAHQTEEVLSSVGDYMSPSGPGTLFCTSLVGGSRVSDNIRLLQSGKLRVAVGTPGRVWDILRRGALRSDGLKVLVLDEADEMLSQGFADQVYEIFKFCPRDVQVCLFSATLPPEVVELTGSFMRSPLTILVKKESLTLEGIKQFYVAVEEDFKLETLTDLYESVSIAQSVIFCNSRRQVDWLAGQLNAQQFTVSFMHADMDKGERERVLSTFRSGSSRVLVTTDLLARGIDVHQVAIVVNYDMPKSSNKETYLHRIGRSGRYGKKGLAINFVSGREVSILKELEAFYHTQVDELPMDFATHLD